MAVEFELLLDEDPDAAELAARVTEFDNEAFLRTVVHEGFTLHHRSSARLLGLPRGGHPDPGTSLLLRALHLCFSAHLPLSLSPDLLWYTVVHEVATHVRLNADDYADLFTDTPGEKQTIQVEDHQLAVDGDWQRSIHLVQQPLRNAVGDLAADLFQPGFSTTTPVDASATLVALMDVVSPYYDFRWLTLCGIPRIRLEGTAADWRLLASRVADLAGWFEGLRPWLRKLRPILATIAGTAAGGPVDQDFWRSIYKWRSYSGGDVVTGWITAFLAHHYGEDGPRPATGEGIGTGELPTHLSRVPFEWQLLGERLRMAFLGGVLGIERDGEWIRPRLGLAVVELTDSPTPLPDDWTLADLNARTGRTDAVEIPTEGLLASAADGKDLNVTRALAFGDCVVVEADGCWYPGHLAFGEFEAWRATGTDLVTAVRTIPR